MSEIILDGTPPIAVVLRRSARARRMSLRVGRTDGRVTLSLPKGVSERAARAFVAEQAGWIRRHVSATPPVQRPVVGGTVMLLGQEVPIVAGPGRSARYDGAVIRVPDDARTAPRVKLLLQELARSHLLSATDRYAAEVGRVPGKISLRDTRSRWGSCSSRGDLMYSWRLVMAPLEVLEYVAAHEVAHLVHMDHSPRFWAQVAAVMPDYAPRRDWLRTHGARLHAWDFAAQPLTQAAE